MERNTRKFSELREKAERGVFSMKRGGRRSCRHGYGGHARASHFKEDKMNHNTNLGLRKGVGDPFAKAMKTGGVANKDREDYRRRS